MAMLPTPCEVLVTPGSWVPLVVAGGNVHVLPGIPRLFQSMVEAHASRFSGPASHSRTLHTMRGEGDVAKPLKEVVAAFPTVRIGSYPNTNWNLSSPDSAPYRVKLVFEGREEEAVAAASEAARKSIPDTTRVACDGRLS